MFKLLKHLIFLKYFLLLIIKKSGIRTKWSTLSFLWTYSELSYLSKSRVKFSNLLKKIWGSTRHLYAIRRWLWDYENKSTNEPRLAKFLLWPIMCIQSSYHTWHIMHGLRAIIGGKGPICPKDYIYCTDGHRLAIWYRLATGRDRHC